MKNNHKLLVLLAVLVPYLAITGCGKSKFSIGRDDPQSEVQKCMQLSAKKKFTEAIECLEIFKSRFPQTQFSTEAELAIADNYFNQKEYLLAADAYNLFVKMHRFNPRLDYAYYRLGLSYLKESPKAIDRDQQYLDEATHYLKTAITAFPQSEYHQAAIDYLKDARSRIARRIYYIGNFYFRTGEYMSAIPRFIDVVNLYPETDTVPKALYKLVVATGKLNRVEEAKLFFSKLEMDYKDNNYTKRAEGKLSNYLAKRAPTEETQ